MYNNNLSITKVDNGFYLQGGREVPDNTIANYLNGTSMPIGTRYEQVGKVFTSLSDLQTFLSEYLKEGK